MKKTLLLTAVILSLITVFLSIKQEPRIAADVAAKPSEFDITNEQAIYPPSHRGASVSADTSPKTTESQLQENDIQDYMAVQRAVFDSKKFNSLLFSDNFMSETPNYISDNKTNESVENQLYLYQTFYNSIHSIPVFSDLSLELAECDIDVCVVSLAGLERLSKDEISQLEDEMLFNKQGLAKVAEMGSGGTYGIVNKDGYSYFRIVYITNPRFTGVN